MSPLVVSDRPRLVRRFDRWLERCFPRIRRLWAAATLVALGWLGSWSAFTLWGHSHQLVYNRSKSLPGWVYFADQQTPVSKGGYVAFYPPASPIVVAHFGDDHPLFLKMVLGVPGDVVRHDGAGNVYINGRYVARIKKLTLRNELLHPGPVGVIPRDCFYAGSPIRDGFDSRYSDIGFVCRGQIFGGARQLL